MQNPVAQHQRHQRDHRGYHCRRPHGIRHVEAHLAVFLRPERLCHRYGEACARPVAETHHEEHHRCRRAHRSQCADAYPAAHDGCIDDEIHLLQDVAQHKRYGKLHDVTHRRPCGHVARGNGLHLLRSRLPFNVFCLHFTSEFFCYPLLSLFVSCKTCSSWLSVLSYAKIYILKQTRATLQ